jgi:hypothetical protein
MSGRRAANPAPTGVTRRSDLAALAALVALFAALGGFIFRPGVVNYDGSAHYAYLPSAIIDGNLDFYNAINPPDAQSRTPTGHVGNLHPIGPAILWAPAFLSAHIVCLTIGASVPGLCQDSFAWLYVSAVSVASALYGFSGLYVVWRCAARLFSAGPAFWALIAVWLASPLLAYMYVIPSMPHALGFGATAAFMTMWWIVPRRPGLLGWFVWGLLGGLLVIVRWQDLIWVLLPISVVVFDVLPYAGGWRRLGSPATPFAVARLAVFAAGLMIVFSPQMIAWNILYGTPLTIPQGDGFMHWTQPAIRDVLFSARHGLFAWMPLALAACVGLVFLARRELKLFIPLMVILALETYFNAAAGDWWGGGAFGPRRFVDVLPIFILGLAGLFERYWFMRRVRTALLAGCVACIIGNWILMTEFYTGLIQPDQPLTWGQALSIITTLPITLDRWLLLYPGIPGQWHMGPYGTSATTLLYLSSFALLAGAAIATYRWLSARHRPPERLWHAVAICVPVTFFAIDAFLWRLP